MATDVLHVKRNISFEVSPSLSGKATNSNFSRTANESFEVDHKFAAPFGPVLVANGSPFTVPFQDLTTGRMIYLEADGPIELRISGGSEAIPVKPPKLPSGQTAKLARVLLDTEITALSITNAVAASDPVCVTGYILGD